MNYLRAIIENIREFYTSEMIPATVILSVLFVVLVLSIYEFAVYRLVSHRSFYNRSFNISIAVVPFFIATIVLCLQSNLVLTLGTIGALAIIRFRTAVKDPVDMVYLLWSIHTGIICGCRLFEIGVLTSLVVTIVLLIFENVKIGGYSQLLTVHTRTYDEKSVVNILKEKTKHFRVKSRSSSSHGFDYIFELSVKNPEELMTMLDQAADIERFSLLEYDSQDIF